VPQRRLNRHAPSLVSTCALSSSHETPSWRGEPSPRRPELGQRAILAVAGASGCGFGRSRAPAEDAAVLAGRRRSRLERRARPTALLAREHDHAQCRVDTTGESVTQPDRPQQLQRAEPPFKLAEQQQIRLAATQIGRRFGDRWYEQCETEGSEDESLLQHLGESFLLPAGGLFRHANAPVGRHRCAGVAVRPRAGPPGAFPLKGLPLEGPARSV
jgi:hypothetical protein